MSYSAMSRVAFWQFERDGWNRAADLYEQCWTDTILFIEPLLEAASASHGDRLLDVACGPGHLSEAAAARGADPVGLDVAPRMLERARRRCPTLKFVEGDAHRLPFEDAEFDAVTMNFGILHLAQPEMALVEAQRVLIPGGRMAFTSWVAEGNAASEIVDAAVTRYATPVALPQGPSYYQFSNPEECRRTIAETGFDPATFTAERIARDWRLPAAELLFAAELHAGVRTAAVLKAQPTEQLEKIRAEITEGVRRYQSSNGFVLTVAALVVSAAKAS